MHMQARLLGLPMPGDNWLYIQAENYELPNYNHYSSVLHNKQAKAIFAPWGEWNWAGRKSEAFVQVTVGQVYQYRLL